MLIMTILLTCILQTKLAPANIIIGSIPLNVPIMPQSLYQQLVQVLSSLILNIAGQDFWQHSTLLDPHIGREFLHCLLIGNS